MQINVLLNSSKKLLSEPFKKSKKPLDEQQFIVQLKEGNSAAYNHLIEQFSDKVFNTIISILQNQEDAEDVTQEVFIAVFNSIKEFKSESKLATWIYRIAVSKALEFLRNKKRKKRFGIIQNLFGMERILPETDNLHFYHPGVKLENKELSAILFKAINQLAETQKTAFVLSKIEELSYVEIAEIMNTSVSSVESLLFRAKQNLQKILADYYQKNHR
ncbi:MAG TPA: RNA polymerase sigma factor [Bacteroidia bacterium]|nr:RNA polymerase sigma factor [Bacteroidia bacterium]